MTVPVRSCVVLSVKVPWWSSQEVPSGKSETAESPATGSSAGDVRVVDLDLGGGVHGLTSACHAGKPSAGPAGFGVAQVARPPRARTRYFWVMSRVVKSEGSIAVNCWLPLMERRPA